MAGPIHWLVVIALHGQRNIRSGLHAYRSTDFSASDGISRLHITICASHGAVLYQEQDGKLRVLGNASRTLTPSEKNYHMHARSNIDADVLFRLPLDPSEYMEGCTAEM